MFEFLNSFLHSRAGYYLIGAAVVLLIVFTTAAKSPNPRCPRCGEFNRPMARFCAHCGNSLAKK